jgi:hypothetical protein
MRQIRPQATPFAAMIGRGGHLLRLGIVFPSAAWRLETDGVGRNVFTLDPPPGDSNTETDKCDLLDFLCRWRNGNRGCIKARGGCGGSPSRSAERNLSAQRQILGWARISNMRLHLSLRRLAMAAGLTLE